jgi:hypothetical protein
MTNDGAGCCCTRLLGLTKLRFLDGDQVTVVGLDEILLSTYDAGKPIDAETAQEILQRVEAKNYVASSIRGEYQELLLQEYRKYVTCREGSNG